jgi:hypothetical protein
MRETAVGNLDYKPHYRRNLPHIQPPGATLFVTFRLAGSVPRAVLDEWAQHKARFEAESARLSTADERKRREREFQRERFARLEKYLDKAPTGPTWLADARIARLVADSLHYRNAKVYRLEAFCIMPNHVHAVFTPLLEDRYSVMNDVVYQVEHSVEAAVSPAFAWDWRTDVKNWDDPPAQFQLDGPFAVGSWGTTRLPGQEPLRWHIRDVRPGRSFVIEMRLDRATLSFEWRFDAVSDRHTRLSQRIVLAGDNASAYAPQVRAAFGSNLPDGMSRIAAAIAAAAASTRSAG